MVRVGGGWCALDEFLVKNDPCRGEYIIFTITSSKYVININERPVIFIMTLQLTKYVHCVPV